MVETRLVGKEYSPLTVRKYNHLKGIPIFVAIITDDGLDDLDKVVLEYLQGYMGKELGLQDLRNIVGGLADRLVSHYRRAEGVAVVAFPDKAAISSLWGDFMNHLHCRMELYALINTMWHL